MSLEVRAYIEGYVSKRGFVVTALVCSCVGVSFAWAYGQSTAGRSPHVERRRPSLVNPDASLGELLHSADAVTAIRVLKRLGTRLLAEPSPAPFTEYDVTPTEVLKSYPTIAFGSVLRIASREGVGQFNGVTLNEVSLAPPLIEGREYLLLLTFSPVLERMLFNSDHVFDLSGTNVIAHEHVRATRHGKELDGLSTEQAVRNIRIMLQGPQ